MRPFRGEAPGRVAGERGACAYREGEGPVGSDLDLVAIVGASGEPFERRALSWDLISLPVSVELLVYTVEEWGRLEAAGGRFARTLARETVSVLPPSRAGHASGT